MKPTLVFTLSILFAAAVDSLHCKAKRPVIFVPGIFGSVVNGHTLPGGIPEQVDLPALCPRNWGDRRLWISGTEFAAWPCFRTYFLKNFNSTSKSWTNCPGIATEVPRWGEIYAVDSLDPSFTIKLFSHYFHDLAEAFASAGYQKDVEILAAAYDWREAPDKEWAEKTRILVEQAYARSQSAVVFVAHSLGCLRTYYFLSLMTPQWRAKFVHRFIAVSPPWGGSLMSLDSFFNGYNIAPFVGRYFGPLARRVPSDWFLLPQANAWPKGAILLSTPSRNYTFSDSDISQLLVDAGDADAHAKVENVRSIIAPFIKYDKPLGIPVTCVLSPGFPTAYSLHSDEDIQRRPPYDEWQRIEGHVNVDGDGTVSINSLRFACDRWAEMGAPVSVKEFPKIGHVAVIKDNTATSYIVDQTCNTP